MSTDILYKQLIEDRIDTDCEGLIVYPSSFNRIGECRIVMFSENGKKQIMVSGEGPLASAINGVKQQGHTIGELCHENRIVINTFFDFTVPRPAGYGTVSVGLGDRLGTASVSHIRAVRDHMVFPVLAQQSTRELDLTGRNFSGVLDDASFAVFQEGYRKGFGADGDHLKNTDDIREVLRCGYTMITLDCSEKIDTHVEEYNDEEMRKGLSNIDVKRLNSYRTRYLNRTFPVNGNHVNFDEKELVRNILTYDAALQFVGEVYTNCIVPHGKAIDLEVSVDETTVPTSPGAHYFIARELADAGIPVTSIAPRFPGEFQKGIDYIGDIALFEKEYGIHQAIAEEFGYKLSVHSGSDKFAVFGIIGRISKGRFHLKTSGTHWLEALRTIAVSDKCLFRKLYEYALQNIQEARRLYHISADTACITPLDKIADDELIGLLDNPHVRQVLHISYGTLLNYRDKHGEFIFRNSIYEAIRTNQKRYNDGITAHVERHLNALGI